MRLGPLLPVVQEGPPLLTYGEELMEMEEGGATLMKVELSVVG